MSRTKTTLRCPEHPLRYPTVSHHGVNSCARSATPAAGGAAPNPKYQAALSVAYGAGLLASDVCALKDTDIDGERIALRVEEGKDLYALLSPVQLERLSYAYFRSTSTGASMTRSSADIHSTASSFKRVRCLKIS